MWRCNNFSKYARDTQVSTLKKFSSFLFEQSGLGNGMVGTGVHGKRKAQVRHGRQGGATFPSSGHCIISSSFFFYFSIFHTKARRQTRSIPQQEPQLQQHSNTIRIGGNQNISFTGIHYGKGRDGGETTRGKSHYISSSLGGNTDWKFHKLGAQHAGESLVLWCG